MFGGMLGGLAGWLVELRAFKWPGVGAFISAGRLTSATHGAGVGGLIGALTAVGVPAGRAHWYGAQVSAGATLLVIQADDRVSVAEAILRAHSASDNVDIVTGRLHATSR